MKVHNIANSEGMGGFSKYKLRVILMLLFGEMKVDSWYCMCVLHLRSEILSLGVGH